MRGGMPELSEQIGVSQETFTNEVVTSWTMSAGQKLHDGGSVSVQEIKHNRIHLNKTVEKDCVHD